MCQVCTVSFASAAELGSHRAEAGHAESVVRADGSRGLACWECGDSAAASLPELQAHFRAVHAALALPAAATVSARHAYAFRCSECSLAFKTAEGLEAHAVYHQMRASTRCAVCARSFRTIPALRRHVEAAHAEGGAPGEAPGDKYRDPARPYKCPVCRESFTQKNILLVHYNSVSHLHKTKKLCEGPPRIANPISSSLCTNKMLHPGRGLPMDQETLAALAREDDVKTAHNGHSNTSPVTRPYKCSVCK